MTKRNLRRMGNLFANAVAMLFCTALFAAPKAVREVIPAKPPGRRVSQATMQKIYERIKTPFKYGVILKGKEGKKVDCPSVFRHGQMWYMIYIIFDGGGYETAIAVSHDLLNWKPLGRILHFREGSWDARQAAGYIANHFRAQVQGAVPAFFLDKGLPFAITRNA